MEEQSLIEKLRIANALTKRIGMILSLTALVRELARAARELAKSERAVILVADDENGTLSIATIAADETTKIERTIPIYNQDDLGINAWLRGESFAAAAGEIATQSPLYHLTQALDMDGFYSVPLHIADQLAAVIVVDNPSTHAPINPALRELLDAIQENAQIAFANARLYSQTITELDVRVREVEMMRQIDRELSDTIALERVFDLTLDWALRYTLAHSASLSLYSDETDELRFVADLGYNVDLEQTQVMRATDGGIALRVARSGHAEVIPDVSVDNDYVVVSGAIRSHMSVPVMREDRVIAVITIENRRLNAFTDDHLSFVAKLRRAPGSPSTTRVCTVKPFVNARNSRTSSAKSPILLW